MLSNRTRLDSAWRKWFLGWILIQMAGFYPAFGSTPSGATLDGLVTSQISALVTFARISTKEPQVQVMMEDVLLNIHRAEVGDIEISSNCPSHWNISGNVIRQAVIPSHTKGVSLRADQLGSQVTVNGKVYLLPRGSDRSIHSLKVQNGTVLVNGIELAPLLGSAEPGLCNGPELLDIRVPQGYQGGLVLSLNGKSVVNLDCWRTGNLTVRLSGPVTFHAGTLDQLSKVVLDSHADGQAEVDNLSARIFVGSVTGAGGIRIVRGSADVSNATVTGGGSIVLHGRFDNLKKAINGSGHIEINP